MPASSQENNTFFRQERSFHATKNGGGSNKKGTSPTIVAKNDNVNSEIKAKWDQMREVQEAMSCAVEQASSPWGSVTKTANRAHTTSVSQRQVAKEEGKKSVGAGSNNPAAVGKKAYKAQTRVRTSASTSTTLFDTRLECYTLDESQSVLIKRETSQLSNSKDEDKLLSSSCGGPETDQWAGIQGEYHPWPPRTRLPWFYWILAMTYREI